MPEALRRPITGQGAPMFLLSCLVAVAAGLLNPLQSGLTSALQGVLGRPFLVAAASLAVSFGLALAAAAFGGFAGAGADAAKAPWWSWLAGVAGLCILVARPYSAPHLGAGAFTGLTVTAAVVASLALDHFGWLGFEQHALGTGRVLGALLMVAGAAAVCLS